MAELEARCRAFIAGPGAASLEQHIELSVEARYPHQVWEIEVPLRGKPETMVMKLRSGFIVGDVYGLG